MIDIDSQLSSEPNNNNNGAGKGATAVDSQQQSGSIASIVEQQQAIAIATELQHISEKSTPQPTPPLSSSPSTALADSANAASARSPADRSHQNRQHHRDDRQQVHGAAAKDDREDDPDDNDDQQPAGCNRKSAPNVINQTTTTTTAAESPSAAESHRAAAAVPPPSRSPRSPHIAVDVSDAPAPPPPVHFGVSRRTVIALAALAGSVAVLCCWATLAFVAETMGWPLDGWGALAVTLVAVAGATGLWHCMGRWLYVAAVTVRRDATGVLRYVRLLYLVHTLQKGNATIGTIFERQVRRHPHKACFVCDGRTWTFAEINEFANRVGNHFQAAGYKAGDVVGLLMENRPEFVAIWVGLSKAGIVVPLINTNLRQTALLHSLTVANCVALVYAHSLRDPVAEVLAQLPQQLALYVYRDSGNDDEEQAAGTATKPAIVHQDLASMMRSASAEGVQCRDTGYRHHSKVLYIYTSGTTGLPKAAVISHSRYVFIAAGIHYIGNLRVSDVYYTPLPLYHTAGGVMSVGQALLFGSTVVLRKKFSASNYFADCAANNCTVAQYIGEMCRYMLATKPSPADREHRIRAVFGNGLRPQIWPQFVERFGIKDVAEFYGATEGNANIVNIDNTVGAIGFVSRIIPAVYPISIIRADQNTGEPIRGADGLCQLCAPNEPGVFIGKIIPNNPSRAFLGYVDRKASSKKVVHDVFVKGDSAFLSGDVLVADERGYLFFKDRTGDTFRWKGENVSTSEVEAQVSNVANFRDTVVYGVEVPNLEGRAGMAAIVDESETLDIAALADAVRNVLPPYARPQFVRVLQQLDMTGTFKLKKLDLQKEGYNPAEVLDPLYYLTAKGMYERLTTEAYGRICSGDIRL